MLVIGADPAINHGALVDASGKIWYDYTATDGMDITLESIYVRGVLAVSPLPHDIILVLDFDRTMASWGKGKQNAEVGMLLGLMSWTIAVTARNIRNASVQFVSPSAVRRCLGLAPQTSKKDVHKHVQNILPASLKGNFHKNKDVRGDCIDAFLLAATYKCTRGLMNG